MNKYFPCRTLPARLMLAGFFSLGMGNAIAAPLTSEELELHNDMRLAPVVVTGTRIEQNSFDLPMSIDSIGGDTVRDGQWQVNLSETASRVPGVVVNNRNNPAQDLGIQIRGFGSRSAFGVRGVRLYQDGIPLTMPDGQGQTGTFNLDTAKNVEYLRGPFSALYGNSSGGVVQIFTEDGPADPTLSGGVSFGSYGTHRETVTYGGDFDGFNIVVNANTVRSDGYRDQSEFRRDTYHAKIKMQLNEDTKLTVVATALDQPDNDDPQGLTRAQYQADRKQVSQATRDFNTRVSKSQEHMGATLDHQLTENDSLRFMAYYGQRDNEQFQSIPIGAQIPAGSGGGVQTIEREFGGIDLRWTHTGNLADKPYNFTIGTNVDRMSDDRKGYENFVGGAGNACNVGGRVCGVKGALRRDEVNRLRAFDQYAQGSIDLDPRWNLNVGIRHSKIKFETDDKYIVGANLDDSGSVTYSETTPVAGIIFKATDTLNFYANAGESFETPTFVEAAYSATAGAGLNRDLKAATSRQYEIGAKWMAGDSTIINAALFKIDTDDEIVVQSSTGGRTVYTNAKESERKGFELSIDSKLAYGLSAYLAYTYLDAEFTKDFTVPVGGAPYTVGSGSSIPGVYKHTFFGELAWKHEPSGFSTAIEARAFSDSHVSFNPVAIGQQVEKTNGYAIASWRAGLNQSIGKWKFNEFLRVENIFDKEYVGSIRVGDSNGAYYEAAPTRNWLLGLNASYQF